jgi:light-harvesting complex 1 beta chain
MNDKVPERWKPLFTNEEWLQHQLVVLGSWIFFVLAGINHVIIAMYKPWFKVTP